MSAQFTNRPGISTIATDVRDDRVEVTVTTTISKALLEHAEPWGTIELAANDTRELVISLLAGRYVKQDALGEASGPDDRDTGEADAYTAGRRVGEARGAGAPSSNL